MAEMKEKHVSSCDHGCSSCSSSDCASRKEHASLQAPLAEGSKVKKVIGVVSGKGGVGKSLVTSLLAVETARNGFRTAILDADVTGPSIPHSFGIHENTYANNNLIHPAETASGIKIMSTNVLLENETDPVVWRGPIVAAAVKQFWSEVDWGEIDIMFVDMPPGTGDVALTVYQSLPLNGVIIVTTPQDMVSMIVTKAVNMAHAMGVPVLGVIENMASFRCPDCGSVHKIFGESHTENICASHGIPLLASLPIDPNVTQEVDHGRAEQVVIGDLGLAVETVLQA